MDEIIYNILNYLDIIVVILGKKDFFCNFKVDFKQFNIEKCIDIIKYFYISFCENKLR